VNPGNVIDDCHYQLYDKYRSQLPGGNRGICIRNPD